MEFSPLVNLGSWVGLAGTIILLIARGYLVPGKTVDKWISILDNQNKELKETITFVRQRNELLVQTVYDLGRLTNTTNTALSAITGAVRRETNEI